MSEKIAQTLVETCLRVGPDEAVTVQTSPHLIELANKVALACYKRGADVLTILDTDEVYYGYMKMLSPEQLKKPSKHCLGLGGYTTTNIYMGGVEDPSHFREIPNENISASLQAEDPHYDLMLNRKIKVAYLALSSITNQRAKTYGLDIVKWRGAVERASSEDYGKMAKFGREVGKILQNGKKVEITAPGGTDLRLELAGRPVQLHDGIVDDEDLANGAYSISIPDGDVSVSVSENSAEGRFVSNLPSPLQGKMIEGISWSFMGGKVTEFNASKNLEVVKPGYDAASGEKDRIAALILGLNTKAEIGQLFNLNQIASGAITITIGDNRGLGGKNRSDFGFPATVSGGTLTIDGRTIIKDGNFTI